MHGYMICSEGIQVQSLGEALLRAARKRHSYSTGSCSHKTPFTAVLLAQHHHLEVGPLSDCLSIRWLVPCCRQPHRFHGAAMQAVVAALTRWLARLQLITCGSRQGPCAGSGHTRGRCSRPRCRTCGVTSKHGRASVSTQRSSAVKGGHDQ